MKAGKSVARARLARANDARVHESDAPERRDDAPPEEVPKGSARIRALGQAESRRQALSPRDEESALQIAAFVGRMLAARRTLRTPDDA